MTAVAIREAAPADLAHVRALFEEYAAWLAVDLCFQGFAEELATLPGAYAPPHGRLYVAQGAAGLVGCIALRPLSEPGVGEVKRLYVRPAGRGSKLGEALMHRLLSDARGIGYRELRLDTLPSMRDARRLYERLGFTERSPYYRNPVPGTVYMSLAL
ncbi:MAG TPA: GNAT family N-acetyltransferase [Casimicrobiaceae bacterium]|nr:GNAT family N-acetyltransferase [Casimicrobiaceae bacterium]